MRNVVRKAVVRILATMLFLVMAIVLTRVLRSGMGAGFLFLEDAVPTALIAVCQDPVLIIAFIVAAILLWIVPWEKIGDEKQEEEEEPKEEPEVLRGRKVESFSRARQRFEVKLKADGARLRTERQGPRQRRDH